jgi:hypothetical protein
MGCSSKLFNQGVHLSQAGYREIFDLGGIIDWRAQGFPVR